MKRFNFVIIVTLLVLAGCGGGILSEKVADYDSLIESGWERYNQMEYDAAYQLFISARKQDAAQPDAYIGSGWALLRRQHPDSAIVLFKAAFNYAESLADTVDTITGLSGSYLARGDNAKVIDLFKKYEIESSSYDTVFPLTEHDFLLDETDLILVQSMACYRLGYYSATEKADPDNALYHINRVLFDPINYTDPETLMTAITDFEDERKGEF